uniref:Protein aurora borealis n=1 Tax=Glossina palpalis gambiensis TaxID=67801 RepID=A0A1B0B8P6_9MUSC
MSTKGNCEVFVSDNKDKSKIVKNITKAVDFSEDINSLQRLQASHSPTMSNESDLSFSWSMDHEVETYTNAIDADELPAFEIRLISPLGRTPSPIRSENMSPSLRTPNFEHLISNNCQNDPEFVTLQDINAQISPPSEHSDADTSLQRTGSLETIFEGVFLNTPPRQRLSMQSRSGSRSRNNLLEKVTFNRLFCCTENKSPQSMERQLLSSCPLDFKSLSLTEETL